MDVNYGQLIYICYKRHEDDNYKKFYIPKKRGGLREIDSPVKGLRIVQKKLSQLLSECVTFRSSVHGFITGKSIVTNARAHKSQQIVLNIDIDNFFGRINFGRVRGLFMAKPFLMSNAVASVLARICIYKNRLPQGSPVSPVVANMIASMLDTKVIKYIKKYNVTYTRYVDDISISTYKKDFPADIAYFCDGITELNPTFREIFKDAQLDISDSKIRLQRKDIDRQSVTGIVINKKLNVPAEYKYRLRAAIKQWCDNPQKAEEKFYSSILGDKNFTPSDSGEKLRQNIYGRLAFLKMVRGSKDPLYINLAMKMAKYDKNPPKFVENINSTYRNYDIFLCHASEDSPTIVSPLAEALKRIRISYFFDNENIFWGDDIVEKINIALTRSKFILAIITEKSIEKEWPRAEINSILKGDIERRQKRLLPLLCGDIEKITSAMPLLTRLSYKVWKDNPIEISQYIKDVLDKADNFR